MYQNSKTFEWFYNKNATCKWIPNLFGEKPFQSTPQSPLLENLLFVNAKKCCKMWFYLDIYLESKNSCITNGKSLSSYSNRYWCFFKSTKTTSSFIKWSLRLCRQTSSFDEMVRPSLLDDVVYGRPLNVPKTRFI